MKLGEFNEMVAYRQSDNGWYLIDETAQEVLLPNKFVPEGMDEGTEVEVFIFLDSDERKTATTQRPLINLNGFARLEVMDVNRVGAFVDWGLDKQLLVPYSEQVSEMQVGRHYVIHLRMDTVTNRLVGSSRIGKFLDNEELTVAEGEEVDLLVYKKTDLGVNVIVNGKHTGLIFQNQIFKKVGYSDSLKGFVNHIREDNRLDIVLEKQGYRNMIDPSTEKVLNHLKESSGYMPFTDKSDPEDIRITFGMSKKNFKKALGALYRQKMVRLEKDGVYLIE